MNAQEVPVFIRNWKTLVKKASKMKPASGLKAPEKTETKGKEVFVLEQWD